MSAEEQVRHILSLSGGKDSTALAIHMRDRVPDMEYVFMDTGEELPETYEYLEKLEVYLQKPITRLQNHRAAFQDLLSVRRGFLPSAQARWCTQYLKLKPFEEYVGSSTVVSYIAIRYDERERKGYISSRGNIRTVYPFIDGLITLQDVNNILNGSGIGLPGYYRWRSRSGCYFCFFQQRIEWVGLLRNHPDLFWKAAEFEKDDEETGKRYTWSGRESLAELARPERIEQIETDHNNALLRWKQCTAPTSLVDMFAEYHGDDSCLICHL